MIVAFRVVIRLYVERTICMLWSIIVNCLDRIHFSFTNSVYNFRVWSVIVTFFIIHKHWFTLYTICHAWSLIVAIHIHIYTLNNISYGH